MYGMLLESIQHFIQLEYGEDVWLKVVADADCRFTVFASHTVYPDCLMTRLAESCARVMGPPHTSSSFMSFFGRCFVRFFTNLGYDAMIKATGRHFSDFLQSVDNIHLQMRFTYPKMKSPSMYISHLDRDGVVLVYRSSRKGFTQYFTGQLNQIAEEIYSIQLSTRVLEELPSGKQVLVRFRLDFDNGAYVDEQLAKNLQLAHSSLPSFQCPTLLNLFPFGVIFDQNLRLIGAGEKLTELIAPKENEDEEDEENEETAEMREKRNEKILGKPVTDFFRLQRPKGIQFTWANLLNLQTVSFELEVIRVPGYEYDEKSEAFSIMRFGRRRSQGIRSVLLKGQMKFIKDINAIVFLCSPLVDNIDELPGMGLYLNDLNIHGLSKEMVMTGWDHGSRLELRFERAEQYSVDLEKSYTLWESWNKRGDELLYSMIPKPIADRLRQGQNTCQAFESVTVLFCELEELNSIPDAMEVVASINAVFTCFDELVDFFHVFKVETVGRVYMAVGGAPEPTPQHADHVADLALSFLNKVKDLKLPTEASKIRIGIHSGPVVAGVVGSKVPRYCLFGDTVNTAARMQTSSLTGKAHISKSTYDSLTPGLYRTENRGTIKVKGKGFMETYWLLDKKIPIRTVIKAPVSRCSSSELPSGQTTKIAAVRRSTSSELDLKKNLKRDVTCVIRKPPHASKSP